MNYDEMLAERESLFNKLCEVVEQKTAEYKAEMAEIESEQLRLQGEFRVITKMKEDSEAEANVIDTVVDSVEFETEE